MEVDSGPGVAASDVLVSVEARDDIDNEVVDGPEDRVGGVEGACVGAGGVKPVAVVDRVCPQRPGRDRDPPRVTPASGVGLELEEEQTRDDEDATC